MVRLRAKPIRRVSEWLAATLEMWCRETGCGFESRALRFFPPGHRQLVVKQVFAAVAAIDPVELGQNWVNQGPVAAVPNERGDRRLLRMEFKIGPAEGGEFRNPQAGTGQADEVGEPAKGGYIYSPQFPRGIGAACLPVSAS